MRLDMPVAIGCGLAGYDLKTALVEKMRQQGYTVWDVGCESAQKGEYPDAAMAVAKKITGGEAERGILICGTGNGIAMAANKIRKIRCALCHERLHVILAREHNDANVLAMGAWLVDEKLALELIEAFLFARYSGDVKHQARIDKMMSFQEEE